MITKESKKTTLFETVRMCDFSQDGTELPEMSETSETSVSQVFEGQMGHRQAHSAGVLAALTGFFQQKRVKKAIL